VFRTVQGALSPLEWGAVGLVVGIGVTSVMAGRTVVFAIVAGVGAGVVVGVRGVMYRCMRDAIEWGVESGVAWERSSVTGRRPDVAPVYRLADKQREPAQR
jgi:hypothetical protein